MLRVGIFGFGGGPSIMPLFRYEIVTRLHLSTEAEFAEALTLANALPGPIATEIAAYFGYRERGIFGAAVCIVAHISPTVLATVSLASVFAHYDHFTAVRDMITAVVPVITVMLIMMTFDFAKKADQALGHWVASVTIFTALGLLILLHVASSTVIVLFIAFGILQAVIQSRWRKQT